MPRVSIIISTYNRSDVLRCAIKTVLLQSFQDWELIVVGDACTDDTAEVMFAFRDPRIRFFNRETNFGEQSAPHNEGFARAQGNLVAYLNHDDLWFPNHLESLVRFLDETGADLVYALRLSLGEDGRAYCGLTNAELRYDPSHIVESSLWLVRCEVIDELKGWRAAKSIHASTPSQDFLTRAWRRGKDIRCHPRVTAIMLHAGTRPNSFKVRNSRQHEELVAAMSDPASCERLVTEALILSTRREHEFSVQLMSEPEHRNYLVDRGLVALGFRPDSVRNWLGRRPKGWFVDHIRQIGGLPPIQKDRE